MKSTSMGKATLYSKASRREESPRLFRRSTQGSRTRGSEREVSPVDPELSPGVRVLQSAPPPSGQRLGTSTSAWPGHRGVGHAVAAQTPERGVRCRCRCQMGSEVTITPGTPAACSVGPTAHPEQLPRTRVTSPAPTRPRHAHGPCCFAGALLHGICDRKPGSGAQKGAAGLDPWWEGSLGRGDRAP